MKVFYHALPIECPTCGTRIIRIINIRVRADQMLIIECLCGRCGTFEDERYFQHWCLWAFCQDAKPETDETERMLEDFKPTGKPN